MKNRVEEQYVDLKTQYEYADRQLLDSRQDFQNFSNQTIFWESYKNEISRFKKQLDIGTTLQYESKQQPTYQEASYKLEKIERLNLRIISIYSKEIAQLNFNLAITNKYIKGIRLNKWEDSMSDVVDTQINKVNEFIDSAISSPNRQETQLLIEEARRLSSGLFQKIPQIQIYKNQPLQKIYYDITTGNITDTIFTVGNDNEVN